jgi:hypothetical protein
MLSYHLQIPAEIGNTITILDFFPSTGRLSTGILGKLVQNPPRFILKKARYILDTGGTWNDYGEPASYTYLEAGVLCPGTTLDVIYYYLAFKSSLVRCPQKDRFAAGWLEHDL